MSGRELGKRRRSFTKGRQTDPSALAEVRRLLGDSERRRDLLIEYLHLVQDRYGHVSARHMAALAEEMRLSQADVYETATFYAHFDVTGEDGAPPPPLSVRVCDGVACELAGGVELLHTLAGVLGDGVRVLRAPCVGACDKAPVAVVGRAQLFHASAGAVAERIEKSGTEPALPAYKDFAAYRAEGGYDVLRECLNGVLKRDELISVIEASGLRGRGGAGFPMARKLRYMQLEATPRVLVVNADEGEPGTFKDRHCLESGLHRVLEGALIAAWVVEAEDVYVFLRDEYPHILEMLACEIPKIEAAGLAGDVRIHLRRGAGAYVCGEETALIECLEGKRGLPRNRPPYPSQSGLFGRPTLVSNVETLYWLCDIVENGAEWFVEAGRPRFYSVSGRVRNPGVKLAPAGTSVKALIEDYCGGMADGHTFAAYLPGGASGGILPASLGDLSLDFGALEAHGCYVGSAAVVVLSDKDNVCDVARSLMAFFADESCGQCTPCRLGTEKLRQLIHKSDWNIELIGELCEAMRDASICGLGQAAPNSALSVIRFFSGKGED